LNFVEAAKQFREGVPPPKVVGDGGSENGGNDLDALINAGIIRWVIARVDILQSNSPVEALFRSLLHQWLYLHKLDTIETVTKLVDFYMPEHNKFPHTAYKGESPDELYQGRGGDVLKQLAQARVEATEKRLAWNRSVRCGTCSDEGH
jgi:hypothetical protein